MATKKLKELGHEQAAALSSTRKKSAKTGTKLAKFPPGEILADPLPGEDAIDNALVSQAFERIREITTAKGLETAKAIGEFLIETFFAGDLAKFTARNKKHASFKALGERMSDLTISQTFLWYSVAVVGQLQQMPTEVGEALPMSHHRLLMPIKDEAVKLSLAKEALSEGLGKRQFEIRVRQERDKKYEDRQPPGRAALPSWARSLGPLLRAAEAMTEDEITDSDVEIHGKALLQDRLAEIERAIGLLESVKAELKAVLA